MVLHIVIFLLFLSIHIVLGLLTKLNAKKLQEKYLIILESGVDPAVFLERMAKNNDNVEVVFSDRLDKPAIANKGYLVIDKRLIYNKDLHSNLYIALEHGLARQEMLILKHLQTILKVLFSSSIILFLFGIVLYDLAPYLLTLAIASHLLIMLIAFVYFIIFDITAAEILDEASEHLELNDFELVQAEKLKNDLKFSVFEYPFALTKRR